MVRIVENWTEIEGEIRDVLTDDSRVGFSAVRVALHQVNEHKPFPNLVRPDSSNEIAVRIKSSEAARLNLRPGTKISAVIRAAPGGLYFVMPESVRNV